MISMVALSGLTALTVNAVDYSVSVYPNSISVGDTVTVSFNTGVSDKNIRLVVWDGDLNNGRYFILLFRFVGLWDGQCISTNTYIVNVLESSGSESSGSESSGSESSG